MRSQISNPTSSLIESKILFTINRKKNIQMLTEEISKLFWSNIDYMGEKEIFIQGLSTPEKLFVSTDVASILITSKLEKSLPCLKFLNLNILPTHNSFYINWEVKKIELNTVNKINFESI